MAEQNLKVVENQNNNEQEQNQKDTTSENQVKKEGFFKKLIRLPKKIHEKISGFAEDHPRLTAGIGTMVGVGVGVGGKMLFDKYRNSQDEGPIETEFLDEETDETTDEPEAEEASEE